MNFYIKQIKLWFNKHPEAKVYDFLPDKVNVITGDSSTGKSSILHVIDYCLFSKESGIVEDVINKNVSWYGLIFHLNGHDYSVARRAPKNGGVHKDIYWAPNTSFLPDDTPIPSADVTRASVEKVVDEVFGINGDALQDGKRVLNLHFRHMLMLSYLTEDIIASMNMLFDTNFFADLDYQRFLQDIIKYALGTSETDQIKLTKQFAELSATIASEEKKKLQDEKNATTYNKQLDELIAEARGLSLIADNASIETILDAVRKYVKEFEILKRSHAKLKNIGDLHQRRHELYCTLKEYQQLQLEYNRAVRYAQTVKDSLMPMDFLLQNLNRQIMTEDTIELYSSLEDTFKRLKTSELTVDKLPDDFEKNKNQVKRDLQKIEAEIAELKKASEIALNPDILYRAISIETRLKNLKEKPRTFCGDVKLQEYTEGLKHTVNQLDYLKLQNEDCIKKLNSEIQSYFDTQDGISESYRSASIEFKVETLSLELRKPGEYFKLKNVGSKSNFMFLHLCFYLGLHQYLRTIDNSKVPNFLFIDQPSIPYYSSRSNQNEDINTLKLSAKDDETKLRSAFKLIESFMYQNVSNEKNKHFQIILIEHADPSYWSDLDHYDTRYIFTDEKDYGLIPKYVEER